MRKTYLTIILALAACCCNAQSSLNKCFQTLENNTLTSNFTITIEQQAQQPMTYKGDIIMKGQQFLLNIIEQQIAYDGLNLYVFREEDNELTITQPTTDELAEINPFIYAKTLTEISSISEKISGQNIIITINPATDNTLTFTLTLRQTDYLPLKMEMKEKAVQTITVKLLSPELTTQTPDFIIKKPNATINDLR